MNGFSCAECDYDLNTRVDLLARYIQQDYPDGDYPPELSVDGNCNSCGAMFSYSGSMFTHFVKTKIEEGVISEDAEEYDLIDISVTEEQMKEFEKLVEEGDNEKIREFIHKLMDK